MRWSFSAHGTFRRCPRQWFYRQVYANSRANDPNRREAYRLSKLGSIQAWRGKLVDTIISEAIIPSISLKQPCNASEMKHKADDLFVLQRAERTMPNAAVSFFEIEYGFPLAEEVFDQALMDVRTALDNFFGAEQVWQIIEQAEAIIPQRALSFMRFNSFQVMFASIPHLNMIFMKLRTSSPYLLLRCRLPLMVATRRILYQKTIR